MKLDEITDHLDRLIDTAGWTEKFAEWEGPSCAAVCICFKDADPRVFRMVSGDQFTTLDNVKAYEIAQPEKSGVWHLAKKTEGPPMDDVPSLQKARDAELDEWRAAMLQWQKDCEKHVLSLRDQFAAAALSGMLDAGDVDLGEWRLKNVCKQAYAWADAMLAAREAK